MPVRAMRHQIFDLGLARRATCFIAAVVTSALYGGSFTFYRDLNTLNSYDQRGTVSARRLLTPHVALWAQDSAVTVPTTELLNFIAVPFVRTGSKLNDLRAGIDAALNKYTSI